MVVTSTVLRYLTGRLILEVYTLWEVIYNPGESR